MTTAQHYTTPYTIRNKSGAPETHHPRTASGNGKSPRRRLADGGYSNQLEPAGTYFTSDEMSTPESVTSWPSGSMTLFASSASLSVFHLSRTLSSMVNG